MKNTFSNKKIILVVIALFVTSVQLVASITVSSPLFMSETTTLGTTYSGTIDIANAGDRNERVQLSKSDYLFTSDGNNRFNNPGTDPRSNAPWITLSSDDVVIAPGKLVKVAYTVNVPTNENLVGTYWSIVFVEAITDTLLNPDKPDDGTVGVEMNLRFGVQIVSQIGHTGKKSIAIDNVQVEKGSEIKTISFDITNTGERSIAANIYAQVYTDKGKYVGRFEGRRTGTFPECSVKASIKFPDLESGKYRMQIIADGGANDVFGILVAPEFL